MSILIPYRNFEKLLEKHNVTAYEVCKHSGVSTITISQWKWNKSIPKTDKLFRIAKYFKVPLEYFIEENDDKPKLKVNFKAKREAKGLSVKDICVLTNIKEKDYLGIESGVKEATSEEMELLKTILNF